jgi:hypothetical protein
MKFSLTSSLICCLMVSMHGRPLLQLTRQRAAKEIFMIQQICRSTGTRLCATGGRNRRGSLGAINNCIFHCIAIEQRILEKTSSGMMGALSVEEEYNLGISLTENSEDNDDDNKDDDNRPKRLC